MNTIHFIEQKDRQMKIREPNVWESGYWRIAEAKANELIGGNIMFHKGQLKPAYMSGEIVGWRKINAGEFVGKVVFEFLRDDARVGETASKQGWGNEKKYSISDSSYDPHNKTAKSTENMWGEKLYQRRARLALPVLVEWAVNKKDTLEYGELADQLDMLHHRPTNKILASVGTTLNEISVEENLEIPPIQVLVVNKNTHLPGAGVGWFISEDNYSALSKLEKRALVDTWHQKIFDYEDWGLVLEKLGLPEYGTLAQAHARAKMPSVSEDTRPETKFKKWLRNFKSEKTAQNYAQALKVTLSGLAKSQEWIKASIFEIESSREFAQFALKIRSTDEFIELNTNGRRIYSAALKWYEQFLNESVGEETEEDIQDLFDDETIDPTTRSSLIKTRLGQGKFRQKLISYWKGCSVTGFLNSKLLVASHIKPWRESTDHERLSLYNGLLLTPNLDKCFDAGLITFDQTGKMIVSTQLERPRALGISDDMRVKLAKQHFSYIRYHREKIFIG